MSGYKSYSIPPQTIQYRVQHSLGDFTIGDIPRARDTYIKKYASHQNSREVDYKILGQDLGAMRSQMSGIAFAPRYVIFHPSFELSEELEIDVNKILAAQICLILGLFTWALLTLGVRLSAIHGPAGTIVATALSTCIFLAMNGRAAPAFLGYVALILSVILPLQNTGSLFKKLALSAVGLWLCSMSTGTFCAALTFFFVSNFTHVGNWLEAEPDAKCQSSGIQFAMIVSNLNILLIALAFCIPLVLRLCFFYGLDFGVVHGVLTHGAGKLLAEHLAVSLAGVGLLVMAMIFGIFGQSNFAQNFRTYVNLYRGPLILIAIPAPLGIFGYLAATLSFIGIILLVAQLVDETVDRASAGSRKQMLGTTP